MLSLTVVVVGCFIGLLVGATGVGAGTLGAPFLIFVLKVDPFVAVGTDLFMNAIVKIAGAIFHQRADNIDRASVVPLGLAAVIGSLLGLAALAFLKSHIGVHASRDVLRQVIGFVLILCAIAIAFASRLRAPHERFDTPGYLFGAGTSIAAITTATGVGVGSLSVPALYFIKGRANVSSIVGTSLVYAAIVGVIGAIGNAALGNVDYRLAGLLLVGALPGVAVGTALASRSPAVLRPIIVAVVATAGVRLLV